jgi:glycine/D-amino acid oxidase-like deaminating enzyme
VDENKLRHNEEKLRRYFHTISGITHFKSDPVLACKFISTSDGLPLTGYFPGKENVIYALGFGGNGIVFSTIVAGLITSYLKKEISNFPLRYRPERLIAARQER